jgi:Domain of Unknown Function with PDB structure (DUF3857)
MNKTLRLLPFLLLPSFSLLSQSFNFAKIERWQDKTVVHEVPKEYNKESAFVILEDRKTEYKIDGKQIFVYTTIYKLIKVLDDKGIEMYNKVYVPVYANAEITKLKARVITSNNKVLDLPKEKIKDLEEDGRKYKLFAMEGLEKGGEVEYTYESRKPFSVFGIDMFQGSNTPTLQSFFWLSAPEHLKFDAKGYNGYNVSKDSIINGERIIVGNDANIRVLEDEKYSFKEPYLKRVEYKLSYNTSTSATTRLYTWKEYAKKLYDYYSLFSPKEDKAVEAFIKQINVDKNANQEEQILKIEDYIKTNINASTKIISEDADNMLQIFKSKNTNRDGITKLFSAVLNKINIPYQIVFPSDRSSTPIDENFENWRLIEATLIYFPKFNKYLSPFDAELRYPFVPADLCGLKGLFLKTTTIGDFTTAVGVFKTVDMLPIENHNHNMKVALKFNATLDSLELNSQQILTGYGAAGYRPIYNFLPKDKQDESTKSIIKSVANSEVIANIKIENTALNDMFYNKPLIISADIKSAELLEKAGNKILIKIGEVIGQQVQMYQEKPRQLPIELPYPHTLARKISLEIPSGYQIKNLADLNFNVVYKENQEATMGFVCSYTVTANNVDIEIDEYYKNIKYSGDIIANFVKVINASADFNKVVLVMEKKK